MNDEFFFDPNEIVGKRIFKTASLIDDPCKLCGMYKHCSSPKMKPYGKGKLGIFIVGEAPGENEDKYNIPFIGKSGEKLNKSLYSLAHIDLDRDCIRSNVLQCRPIDNKFDEDKIQFCYARLEEQLTSAKPKLIMCFGQKAAARILETESNPIPGLNGSSFNLIQGDVYFSRKYNAWVSLHYHPAYILRTPDIEDIWLDGLNYGLSFLDEPAPKSILKTGKNVLVEKPSDIVKLLKKLGDSELMVSIDWETKGLNPFRSTFEILVLNITDSDDVGYVIPMKPKIDNVWDATKSFLKSKAVKNCHKFDAVVTYAQFGFPLGNWGWDIMLSQHVLDERPKKKSLEYLSFSATGEEYKESIDRADFEKSWNNNRKGSVNYCGWDARFPVRIANNHAVMLESDNLMSPFEFLQRGNVALADLEYNGVKIDREEYFRFKESTERDEKEVSFRLSNDPNVKDFKRRYGHSPDYESPTDMKRLFFDLLSIEPLSHTEKGNPQVNDLFFEHLASGDSDLAGFVKDIQMYKGVRKLSGTYLESIVKYVDDDWVLHPVYNLWIPRTYRSSCDSPNLQNVPKRDDYQRGFRRIFVPANDYFLEADYKGAEVVIQAIMAQDKALLKQLNEGFDPHKYWASRLFRVALEQVDKKMRFVGKNKFVFPEFYGAGAFSIAANTGLPIQQVERVENEFYGMYSGVSRWQEMKWDEYQKYGYVTTPLGFRRRGPLEYTQVVNTPIQATAFHALLDALIRATAEFRRLKLRSKMVLQVHDSILIDTVASEHDLVMEIINEYTSDKALWKWCTGARLNVDWQKGSNWLDMEELKAA